jgi:hypothetical protein
VDVQAVRNIIRNARKEKELAKPPKYFRELFQAIKTALEATDADAAPDNAPEPKHEPADPTDIARRPQEPDELVVGLCRSDRASPASTRTRHPGAADWLGKPLTTPWQSSNG